MPGGIADCNPAEPLDRTYSLEATFDVATWW
jgi:hypothetical protein